MSDLIGIGGRIRRLRRQAGLSRDSLANQAGVSRARIEALENNRAKEIGYLAVRRLFLALGHDIQIVRKVDRTPMPDASGDRKDPA